MIQSWSIKTQVEFYNSFSLKRMEPPSKKLCVPGVTASICSICNEILAHICTFLDDKSFIRFGSTCKRLLELFEVEYIWNLYFEREWCLEFLQSRNLGSNWRQRLITARTLPESDFYRFKTRFQRYLLFLQSNQKNFRTDSRLDNYS